MSIFIWYDSRSQNYNDFILICHSLHGPEEHSDRIVFFNVINLNFMYTQGYAFSILIGGRGRKRKGNSE